MLPGFIPRLRSELIRAVSHNPPSPSAQSLGRGRPKPPQYNRYSALHSLVPYFAILNDPSPHPGTASSSNAGKAPAFTPAAMPWIGGSLAGYGFPILIS